MVSENKESILLIPLFDNFITKYKKLIDNVTTVTVFDTYFIGEHQELVHESLINLLRERVPSFKDSMFKNVRI